MSALKIGFCSSDVPHTKTSTLLYTKLESRKLAGDPPKLQWAGTPRYKLEQLSSTSHKSLNLALTLKLELA